MGKSDRVSGSFWFLFCLFIIYESYRLGLGTMYQPGPGFLFFWTGIVVAIMALIVVLKSFGARAAEEFEADLIVMATHGKAGAQAFWSGSVCARVLSRSRASMLLVPAERPAGEDAAAAREGAP